MSDNEGSVFNEDFDEEVEESEDTTTSEDEENTEQTEDKTSEEEKSSESTLKDQELTEKGTKLDDNPLSRVNQELANERAKIRRYEQVLNDPQLLKGYVAQFDKNEPQKEEKSDEPELRYEDVKTTEDLQKFLKQQDTKVQAKIKELDSTISNVKSSQKDTVVASQIQSDITAIRSRWDELDPKRDSEGKPTNPNYNETLDKSIGMLYEKFDLDPQTKSFQGKIRISEIADIVMAAAGSSKKQGSTEAQTIVRDKRTGRAVSGASSTAPDESNMSPGQLIAARIRAAAGRR